MVALSRFRGVLGKIGALSAVLRSSARWPRGMGQPVSGGPAAGLGSEVAVLEAVAVAFEAEDLGVMDEPVDHRGGGHVVAEDLAPRGERLVAGDDHRCSFVAAGDEHEHQARGLGVERDVADLVTDQQRDPLQAGEFFVELALALRVGQEGDPFGRGLEQDALAGEARADPQARSRCASCRSPASSGRTTHVVEFLPERVRLIAAPGELRDVELGVLGWSTDDSSGRDGVVVSAAGRQLGRDPGAVDGSAVAGRADGDCRRARVAGGVAVVVGRGRAVRSRRPRSGSSLLRKRR